MVFEKKIKSTKKKNSIKEYEKREIMSPKNIIELTSTVDILMILLSLGTMVVRKVFFLFLEKNTQKTPKKNTQKKHQSKIKKHQK